MVSSSVLDSHANVTVGGHSGVVQASDGASNFYLSAARGDIINYARNGSDLTIEFSDGQSLTIRDFFLGGDDFNNLVLREGETLFRVNFSNAFSDEGDGIVDPNVIYERITETGSVGALLAVLGASAAAVGVVVANLSDDSPPPPRRYRHPLTRVCQAFGMLWMPILVRLPRAV